MSALLLISIENVVLWNEDVKSKFQKVILFFKKLADIKSNLTLPPTTIRPGVTLGIKDYQVESINGSLSRKDP